MIYLFLTIVCTTFLFILFRLCGTFKINIFQTIVWNYVVCSITGFIHQYNTLTKTLYIKHVDTVVAASILGSCFLPTFFLAAVSTQRAGLTPTTMANKLSMIIPAGFAVIIGLAPFGWLQFAAFTLGIVAVFVVSRKNTEEVSASSNAYLPWLVFFCAGLLDLAILYINSNIVTAESIGLFSLHTFTAAACWGLISLSVIVYLKHSEFQWKALLSGIALGIPNYFSVYYLLQTLSHFNHDGSFVFPMLNLSVILLTALVSVLFFKEKFTAKIILGLALASSSILLLYLIKV